MTNEEYLVKMIVEDEYKKAKSNQDMQYADFSAALDMLDMVRSEKNYEWLSDIYWPEFITMLFTDVSNWANQYFQNRDFVDVFLEGENPTDKSTCAAIKKLINKTLNNKDIYYFQKYIRARLINALAGYVYLKCWWESESSQELVGYEDVKLDTDTNGLPFVDPTTQIRATEKKPIYKTVYKLDRFNFDVVDPRNVYTDNKYCYSIQQKDWLILRSEMSFDELRDNKKQNAYFNLDKLEPHKMSKLETETSKETFNEDDRMEVFATSSPMFDVLERFGKTWVKVQERTPAGYPKKVVSGIGDHGVPIKGAELVDCISTVVMIGENSQSVLIRLQPTPFLDAYGKPFKPFIRGNCYIHPTKDTGMSSAKYQRELQVAINDTFNMTVDRTKLATLPVMKGRRYSLEDNSTVYLEPEHVILLDDPATDLQELKISDNIEGGLSQIGMLRQAMNQLEAVSPNDMGQLSKSRRSATEVSDSQGNSSTRGNYKSLTVEHTLLIPLYNMMIDMTSQFMQPDTALAIMGEDAYNFNANADYTYVPVSSNIELEFTKTRKIQQLDQVLGRLINFPNPKTPVLLNQIMVMIFDLLGKQYQEVKNALLDESTPMPEVAEGQQQMREQNIMPGQNQNAGVQSGMEQATRLEGGY